jgi:hypothetical protein
MKQHRQKTAGLALMTVAAFIVTAWASFAVADGSTKKLQEITEKGYIYDVFRRQSNRPEHESALITVVQTRVQTRKNFEIMHGLVFLQTMGESQHGKGIVCGHSDPRSRSTSNEGASFESTDSALECHQHIGGVKETLTIGALDSEFCGELRQRVNLDEDHLTPLGKNPVATPEECTEKYGEEGECVCYEIKQEPPSDGDGDLLNPPNSGSGTGGHR